MLEGIRKYVDDIRNRTLKYLKDRISIFCPGVNTGRPPAIAQR